jgi:hypothetical protein
LELLRAGDRYWQPAPLEVLRQVHQPILAWLGDLGWLEWQHHPEESWRRVLRAWLYSHQPWPTAQSLKEPTPVVLHKGEPSADLSSTTAACRQALDDWASHLPLRTVPEWLHMIAVHTTLEYAFRGLWVWTYVRPYSLLVVAGWDMRESEDEFRRRARRDHDYLVSAHTRDVRHACGLGLRENSTREATLVRDACWTARYLIGTSGYRMDPHYYEAAVLRAIHRFCSRIGLDLASVRLPVTRRPAQEGQRCQAAGSLTLGDSLGATTRKWGENPAKAGANSSGVNLRQTKPIPVIFNILY